MASKYAKIINKLPRAYGTEPAAREKVDAIKREILSQEAHAFPDEVVSNAVQNAIEETKQVTGIVKDHLMALPGPRRHASVFATGYLHARRLKEALEDQISDLDKIMSAYVELMDAQYEAEGVTSVSLEGYGNVRIQAEPHAKVVDKDANREWAIKVGLERSLTLPWQTLNALTKDLLLRDEKEPDGVEAQARVKVVWTRDKASE